MRGQGIDFPEDPDLSVSAAATPGRDEPPAAEADRSVADVGPPGRHDERIASLRALVGRLAPGAVGAGAPIPLGLAALDRALGGGLPQAALHVVTGTPGHALAGSLRSEEAVTGFAAFLLGRLQCLTDGPLLWLPARSDLYGPGLAQLGLDTGRLILVETPRPADRLWAFEEALRTPGLAGAVAEIDRIEPKAARRLQLAAETAGTFGLLLQSPGGNGGSMPIIAATTRWQVSAQPGGVGADGFPDCFERARWRLALLRSRLGRPGSWNVEVHYDPSTDRLALAAALCDGTNSERIAASVGAGG